jgi:hypothetical protein
MAFIVQLKYMGSTLSKLWCGSKIIMKERVLYFGSHSKQFSMYVFPKKLKSSI